MSAVTETMPKSNPAFVLKGINDVGFEERPMPDPSTLDPYECGTFIWPASSSATQTNRCTFLVQGSRCSQSYWYLWIRYAGLSILDRAYAFSQATSLNRHSLYAPLHQSLPEELFLMCAQRLEAW